MSQGLKKAISIHPNCLTDSDYDYILEEIDRWDKIEFERYVDVLSDYEESLDEYLNGYYMYFLYTYILTMNM